MPLQLLLEPLHIFGACFCTSFIFGIPYIHSHFINLFPEISLVFFFQVMTTFVSPPPAATFLAFHPQDNNIIAIGMEDSTILIYNVRVDEVNILPWLDLYSCCLQAFSYVWLFERN